MAWCQRCCAAPGCAAVGEFAFLCPSCHDAVAEAAADGLDAAEHARRCRTSQPVERLPDRPTDRYDYKQMAIDQAWERAQARRRA